MVKIQLFLGIISLSLLVGCSNVGSICPPFPKPTANVLRQIESLKSEDVNNWIDSLYKHNLKIRYCRGDFK